MGSEKNSGESQSGEVQIEALGIGGNSQVISNPKWIKYDNRHVEGTKPKTSQTYKQCQSFCSSPFHLNLCYSCGMPGDFYEKLTPGEIKPANVCRSTFHDMVCFSCGKGESYCKFDPKSKNQIVAQSTGDYNVATKIPETNSH